MSVDAPSFKPNVASASLSPVRMPILNATENQEILKQNIAHMYKYYNDLINRGSDSTTKFDRPTLPETNSFIPRHETSPIPNATFSDQPANARGFQGVVQEPVRMPSTDAGSISVGKNQNCDI